MESGDVYVPTDWLMEVFPARRERLRQVEEIRLGYRGMGRENSASGGLCGRGLIVGKSLRIEC